MRQLMEKEKISNQQLPTSPPAATDGAMAPTNGDNFMRRNNRGCKSKEFYDWPEQAFEDMDSPLAVQQYIQQLVHRNPADIDEILRLPEGQDLGAWKIEHLRMFCMQLNKLAAQLQDCCFPETCNQMTATEQWIFLCAAHKQPNECPAIDYTRHTLDGAASLLNSNKYFPSRVTIKESSVAKLGSVCRRVYRIFSHAYYHHFQVFDNFERETHLCKRFSKFVTMYELMPKESLIVPADGSKPEVDIEKPSGGGQSDTTVLDGTTDATPKQQTQPETSDDEPNAAIMEAQKSAPIDRDPEPKIKTEAVVTDTPEPTKDQAAVAASRPAAPAAVVAAPSAAATVIPKSEPKSPKEEAPASTGVPKKPNANPTTASPPKSTRWTPSQMSTNTMVKSSPNSRSTAPSDAGPASSSDTKTSPKSTAPDAAAVVATATSDQQ